MSITAPRLWKWARGYAKKREDAGKGTVYPTMREATKRFHCTLDDIEDVVGDDIEDDDEIGPDHYLGIGVAWGVNGGMAPIEVRGEQIIEAY